MEIVWRGGAPPPGARDTDDACAACNTGSRAMDHDIDGAHVAVQIERSGQVAAAYCSRSGCHATGDLG